MTKFIAWLQETLKERLLSKVKIDEFLTEYRAGEKGSPVLAISHFRATDKSDILKVSRYNATTDC